MADDLGLDMLRRIRADRGRLRLENGLGRHRLEAARTAAAALLPRADAALAAWLTHILGRIDKVLAARARHGR